MKDWAKNMNLLEFLSSLLKAYNNKGKVREGWVKGKGGQVAN